MCNSDPRSLTSCTLACLGAHLRPELRQQSAHPHTKPHWRSTSASRPPAATPSATTPANMPHAACSGGCATPVVHSWLARGRDTLPLTFARPCASSAHRSPGAAALSREELQRSCRRMRECRPKHVVHKKRQPRCPQSLGRNLCPYPCIHPHCRIPPLLVGTLARSSKRYEGYSCATPWACSEKA